MELYLSPTNGTLFWSAYFGGSPKEEMLALADYATSPLYSEVERVTLKYADAIPITGREVDNTLFTSLLRRYDADALVELTEIITR